MNELKKYLALVRRYRIAVISIPLLAVIITYFLVSNLPDSFSSQSRISTGLVDRTQSSVIGTGQSRPQGMELQQQFSNIVELIQMKVVLDKVGYQLVLHDLRSRSPYRSGGKYVQGLSPATLRQAVRLFTHKINHPSDSIMSENDEGVLRKIVEDYKYDSESLKRNLRVYHAGESDFINIDFEAENPDLSAFVANTVAREFIRYNRGVTERSVSKESDVLRRLIDQKKVELNSAVDSLKQYKIRNRVLNLNEQSSQLYAQIIQYHDQKQAILKDIAANSGAASEIDRKFNPSERRYLESAVASLNQRIVGTKAQLQNLYDRYIQSNFNDAIKNSIDSLQRILSAQVSNTNDTYAYNPLTTKESLVQQKLTLEVQLDLSRYSLSTIERELARLNAEFDQMVPHEAYVQSLERDVEVASDEYLDVLAKYNAQSIASQFSVKLNIAQYAMPGAPQPNKKMLLILISGVISFVFCLLIVFVFFLFDQSVSTPEELANKTKLRVIGSFDKFRAGEIELGNLWSSKGAKGALNLKEDLRALRFELENFMTGKVLSISSLRKSEGKTFTALSLAYAFKMVNKAVLIIDGDFTKSEISRSFGNKETFYLEDYFSGKISTDSVSPNAFINILSNKGSDSSVLELDTRNEINERFKKLRDRFDIIIIDTPALLNNTQAREWIRFSDTCLGVFEAGKSLAAESGKDLEFLQSIDTKFSGWLLNKVNGKP